MTQLLVSVRSSKEAAEALRGGADWIDLKDPAQGALGAVSSSVAHDAVRVVAGRAPVSAACGELTQWTGAEALASHLPPGVAMAKVGLAGSAQVDWRSQWTSLRSQLARDQRQLVAVAYADETAAKSPPASEVIALAANFGGYLLFDTFDKSGGSILDQWGVDALTSMLRSVREAGLQSVVAGRLHAEEIPRLPLELIDMIGVRGAACEAAAMAQYLPCAYSSCAKR